MIMYHDERIFDGDGNVKIAPQDFSGAQQQQARKNIGINGSGDTYFVYVDPATISDKTKFTNVIRKYPLGALIVYGVNWNDWQSYPGWAGSGGYAIIMGSSSFCYAVNRKYSEKNFTSAMYWTDNMDNCSGWISL